MAATASKAPANCITMNIGAEPGWIPAKVSDRVRVTDTAGLANDVDEVNQYAPPMKAATADAYLSSRRAQSRLECEALRRTSK